MKHDEFVQKGTRHIYEVQNINRELIEKALEMRALAYIANVKADLLTQTIFKMSSSKKALWRESEKRFQVFAQTATDAIIVVGTDKIIRFFNKAAEKIYGYSAYEVIGKNVQVLIPQRDWKGYEIEFKRYLRTGRAQIIGKTIELEGLRKDGTMFPIELSLSESQIAGEVTLNAIIRDITTSKKIEEDLKQSEERYRTLIETIPHGIVEIDPSGVFTFCNKAYCEVHGYEKKELLGRNVSDILASDYERNRSQQNMEMVLKEQPQPIPYLTQDITKDGKVIDVQVDWNYKRDTEGNLTGFISVVTDITERKRMENALRESEERYRAVFEQAADSVVIIDVDTGDILEFNDRAHDNLGYPREEFKKLRIADFEVIESEEEVKKHIKKIIKEGSDTFETKHRTKNGEIRDILISTRTLSISGRNLISGLWQDITERKRAEEALRESKKRYQALAEISPVGIFHTDAAGNCLYVNEQWCMIAGMTAKEAQGKGWAQGLHPEDSERIFKEWSLAAENGLPFQSEYRFRTPEGVTIWVFGQARAELDESGVIVGHVGTITDITDRKKAEEALQKAHDELEQRVEERTNELAKANEQLQADVTERKRTGKKLRSLASELSLTEERERRRIANVLHDGITQKLILFKIKLGLFRENKLGRKVDEPFTEIYELLDNIVQDTRTLTFDLSCPILYELGLAAAIKQLLEIEIAQEHRIITEFQTDEQEMHLDEDLRAVLYRAVKELFFNVVKHAKAENIKFSMWKDKSKLWLTVKDDGIGFKKESGDFKYSKTEGFGLFNIRERLGQFGGSVKIESEPGRGTQVTLVVPINFEEYDTMGD